MSDVNAAAEAMGIPAELVTRSAAARAEASGMSTDEVIAAWSGGGSVAAPPAEESAEGATEDAADATPDAAAPETQAPAPDPDAAPEDPEPPSLEVPTTPPAASDDKAAIVATPPGKPPVLVGVKDNPWAIVAGAAALFLGVVLLGLVGPSIPTDAPGARTSHVALSESGETGQAIYDGLGCASCHTQMIRPVVADVGLGPVTLSDTNQILGTRRYGPDLSDVGSRLSATQLEAIVRGSGGHQAHNLSTDDINDLVTYLLESHTAVEMPEPEEPADG